MNVWTQFIWALIYGSRPTTNLLSPIESTGEYIACFITNCVVLQVQQDFITGRLDGMALDYMYWMAGIDMARKAQDEKTDFKGLL